MKHDFSGAIRANEEGGSVDHPVIQNNTKKRKAYKQTNGTLVMCLRATIAWFLKWLPPIPFPCAFYLEDARAAGWPDIVVVELGVD